MTQALTHKPSTITNNTTPQKHPSILNPSKPPPNSIPIPTTPTKTSCPKSPKTTNSLYQSPKTKTPKDTPISLIQRRKKTRNKKIKTPLKTKTLWSHLLILKKPNLMTWKTCTKTMSLKWLISRLIWVGPGTLYNTWKTCKTSIKAQ